MGDLGQRELFNLGLASVPNTMVKAPTRYNFSNTQTTFWPMECCAQHFWSQEQSFYLATIDFVESAKPYTELVLIM